MGNAQSAAGHSQHHNRLVKPKTNTNSPSLTPKILESPTSVSSRYASLNTRERQQIRTQLLSPLETEFGQSRLSHGDDDVAELATDLQRRLSGVSRTNSPTCFGNTRNSTTKLISLPSSKVSLVSNSQTVDLETAIKIVQEVKRNASPEDLAALQHALQSPAQCPSPRQSPNPEPSLNRRTSLLHRSTSSLLRRRSLGTTPGVATRHSPVEGIRRTWNSWKTPKVDAQEEAKWHVEMMGKSPRTRLAALDLAEEHRGSPTPRAQTPGEMEYSHLGSLKLGSLRVTNGAASPAPSTRHGRRRSNSNLYEGDYFAPHELHDSPIMMKPVKRRGHGRSKSTVEPPTPPLYRRSVLSDQARRAKTISRCDSPQKAPSHSLLFFDDSEPEPVRRLRVMNKSADTLADTLAKDCSEGPTNGQSQGLEHQDESFVSDYDESFREEAFRLLNGTIFKEPIPMVEQTDAEMQPSHVTETSNDRPKTPKRAFNRPPPTKADSGYSSGGSFRLVQQECLKEGTVPTLSKKASAAADAPRSGSSDSDDASSLYTFEQMLHLSGAQTAQPPVTASEDIALSLSSTHVQYGTVSQTQNPITHIIDVRSLEYGPPKSPVSVVSQFSADSKTSTARRLQKRRPSIQELPVVQSCELIPKANVPSVPADVRNKFVRRLSETPGMDCLTRTYPSKDHLGDESNTATASFPAISIRFPSPPPSPEPRGRHHQRSATERPKSPRPSGLRRSLSLFRSKSKAKEEEKEMERRQEKNASPNLLEFGTIATSLGRSPYDAAMVPTRHKSVTSPTHPHQLGEAMPRARSMVNMDAETAAEFARMRSKDRALLRPAIPQRPRSFHDIYRRRPHENYEDPPSIPSVPAMSMVEANRLSVPYIPEPIHPVEQQPLTEAAAGIRARTTGRGPVVSEIIDKFDQNGQSAVESQYQDWQPHARLWSQRRKSIGEGLRQRAEEEEEQARSYALHEQAIPQLPSQYTGYGIRQLHSYASRRSTPFSHHYAADLSHAPMFLERA
ncbi:hypothetical protein K458DRAFT_29004 [Lentithecium fluviatile CBS 122367]|uniref:Uncharacterized protein n=1 Tax=Lentithecium fluviatile CBS 122367 TaxID=1168545 RepID=A0A6G1J3Z4_9PLEO|nr:hypothetical protein K458DRAFT_29004 [Lentithecium fluviatile CBS 122367]